MEGFVYILSNESMPGLIKIGVTGKDVEERMRELYSTGVPTPFECIYACKVDKDIYAIEKALHNAFQAYRINDRREFFNVDPALVIPLLKLHSIEDCTDIIRKDTIIEDSTIKPSPKSKSMNLLQYGAAGTVLRFVDDPEITVTIYDNDNVWYNDDVINLKNLTGLLLDIKFGFWTNTHWTCNGVRLRDFSFNE